MVKIGVLAIQGSVIEHIEALKNLDIEVTEVRHPEDLAGIQGIILPGGESTTQSKLMKRYKLFAPLKEKISQGLSVWGTCAGAILLSKNDPNAMQLMDIESDRNAYGTQIDSFTAKIDFNGKEVEAVFIRAPKLKALDDNVEILATHNDEHIALKQENMLATSFHPELTDDTTFHEYFISMCAENQV